LKIFYDTALLVSAVYGEPGSVKMVLQKKLKRIWSCRAQQEDSLFGLFNHPENLVLNSAGQKPPNQYALTFVHPI
jgi:hypothetical protein